MDRIALSSIPLEYARRRRPCELAESIHSSSRRCHRRRHTDIQASRLRQQDLVNGSRALLRCISKRAARGKPNRNVKNRCSSSSGSAHDRDLVLVRGAMTLNLLKSRYITSSAAALVHSSRDREDPRGVLGWGEESIFPTTI